MKFKVLYLGSAEAAGQLADPEVSRRLDVVSLSKMPDMPATLKNQGYSLALVDSGIENYQDVCFLARYLCRLRVVVLLRGDADANGLVSPDVDGFIARVSDGRKLANDLCKVAEKGEPEFSTINVLSVEDDRSIREAIKACFRVYWPEASLRTTERGVEAVRLIADVRPTIILLDLGLPDFSGIEVLSQIKAFSDAPVLVITANATAEYVTKAIENGARDYLAKPFTNRELMHRVRRLAFWRTEIGSFA